MFENFKNHRRLTGACLGVMLVGCSRYPLGAPIAPLGPVPQTRLHQPLGRSWMSPAASKHDLLYVNDGESNVYVYTYPQGQLVGTLTGFSSPTGECVDHAGDVFITAASEESGSGVIYEYAHGGTTPIETLGDSDPAFGCAVDPRSGNLAVTGGGVAIYQHARGKPVVYDGSEPTYFCGYDNQGDLYLSVIDDSHLDQEDLSMLAKGGKTLKQISLSVPLYATLPLPSSVQWDGTYITASSASQNVGVGYDGPISLYRLHISKDSASVVGTATLSSKKNARRTGQIWIQGKRVLGSDYNRHSGGVDSWSYPDARKARSIVPNSGEVDPVGIAVSLAVSQ